MEMITKRISEEKDSLYYEQVRRYTNDFQFLDEYPEVIRAAYGKKIKKFTDEESYNRFCDLRNLIKLGYKEYPRICELLERKNISDTDKKILSKRKAVIERDRNLER